MVINLKKSISLYVNISIIELSKRKIIKKVMIKMIESQGKRLIIDTSEYSNPDFKSITYLTCSKKAETLYLVHQNSDKEDECYELSTSAEELTNIRDYLIDVVSKIEKNYGLEQSVKIIKRD